MASHFLPVFKANAEHDLRELEVLLRSDAVSAATLARACKLHRIHAIACLLMTADSAEFRRSLLASGRRLGAWLERRGEHGLALSRCTGWFDAVAADDWDGARKVARSLQRIEHDGAAEYEESYCYTRLLVSRLAADGVHDSERMAILARYRALEGDEPDWRLELVTALENADQTEYEHALEELMLAERDRFDDLRAQDALPPDELDTLGYVSIEGVALWRLGLRAGFALQSDYLFIPGSVLDAPPPRA